MSNLAHDVRILIVRCSAIGDVLHAVPSLNALRDALPRSYLAWVVEGRSADVLRGHGALDELVTAPRGWIKSPRAVLDLHRRLRALRFDIAIDMQGLSKSAVAARLSGARRRIGFDGRDGREISRWLNNELVHATRTHIVERNLELLAPLGIVNARPRFDLAACPDAEIAAARILELMRLDREFAMVNPGAGFPSKLWPTSRYGEVARHLGQTRKLRSLVVWAGAQERTWAEEIVAGSAGFAALAPATSLPELASIARRATLFIGSDTGPLHLAAAVGTPCVGLFGPVSAERNGPYGTQHVSVQKMWLPERHPRRRTERETMRAISVEDATAACERILDRPQIERRSA